MITCIAIDDEPLALRLLESYIERKNTNLKYLGGFNDALAAQAFLKDNPVDLLFLDIQMPDINGLEIYKELVQKPMVIFTTAYSDFAAEGFDLEAIDYLLKPFTYERFERAVSKALEYRNYKRGGHKEDQDIVYVKSGYELVRVSLKQITYVEGLDDYIKIHVENARTVVTLMTLKSFLEKVPASMFIRCHRSFIVPVDKIKGIKNKKVVLDSIELPIGETYLPSIQQLVKQI